MITPAGSECPYYFEDFHRGRSTQTCRLIERTPGGGEWQPSLCQRCRVPAIVRANACQHLVLEAKASGGVLGFGRRVQVTATCTHSLETVAEPEIGCGQCHMDLPMFETAPDQA